MYNTSHNCTQSAFPMPKGITQIGLDVWIKDKKKAETNLLVLFVIGFFDTLYFGKVKTLPLTCWE